MSAWDNPSTKGMPKGTVEGIGNNPLHSKPTPDHTTGQARGGISRSRVQVQKSRYTETVTDRKPMREIYADELAWAARHLPDEYGPFVALGVARLKRQGTEPTVEKVLAYLRELGRDRASREVQSG